ncbi:MAG: molybdopterin molybdotransferase MoeA [Clostridiales bacterium]|nr:molybdopterin molybdotransferase MoeA [Clostridia bacterium]MCR4883055.1 molybdopterin molybdotransferase MoeA [Clostridiales bacterium]
MQTPESALELLLKHALPVSRTEIVALEKALGRVLSEDIVSPMPVPPFDRSPLDGYALCSADIATASREHPVHLRVIGEADAGCTEHFTLTRGEALRIMTGAPVPACCDCVIRQEDTDEGMEQVEIYVSVASGMNVVRAGEDVTQGAVLLRKGTRLGSAALGVLASIGSTAVPVYDRPHVVLLCTGDELVQPGEELVYGKIYDSSRTNLTARLRELGCHVILCPSVPDDPEYAAAAIRANLPEADLVLTTGGVSVGKKDIMHQVLPLLGAERLFWKVAMKPGSPLLCGLVEKKLMICLSGNPFAALAGFELFAKPVLQILAGCTEPVNRRMKAVLRGSFRKGSPQRRMIRGTVWAGEVSPTPGMQTNGALSAMIGCNCLIDIPAGTGPLEEGSMVEVVIL